MTRSYLLTLATLAGLSVWAATAFAQTVPAKTPEQARKLGNATVVLMRGHGDAVVGQSVKHAVLHAIYTEFNARIQSDALKLGGNITFLNEAERQRSAPGMTQAWTGPGNCGSARRWRGNSADLQRQVPMAAA